MEQTINTLKKVFISLKVINDDDLKKLMTISESLDSQSVLNIINESALKLDIDDLERILRFLPIIHQEIINTYILVVSKKDESSKIVKAHLKLKNRIIAFLRNNYLQDKTTDKVLYKYYLNNLSNQELNYGLKFLEDEPEDIFKKDTIGLIEDILTKQKEKN